MAEDSPKTIEEKFALLEEQIRRLESGELSLEDAFKTYEAGIRMISECTKHLDRVEKQIIVLKEKGIPEDE